MGKKRKMLTTVWGGRLRKRFCNMFSESSTGSWAELQLPCSPSKQGELLDNMLQNLSLNLPPQTVEKTAELDGKILQLVPERFGEKGIS